MGSQRVRHNLAVSTQYSITSKSTWASLVAQCKESSCQCRRCKFNPWIGKICWRRKSQPTPLFLPEKSHWQGRLTSHSSRSCKESDMTEWLRIHTKSIYFILSSVDGHVLLPCLGYCKQCCYEHWDACIIWIRIFPRYMPRSRIAVSHGHIKQVFWVFFFCVCVCVAKCWLLSHVWLLATTWTVSSVHGIL